MPAPQIGGVAATLIGVPTQGAGEPVGTARGVGALRTASLVAELQRVSDLLDAGDVALPPRPRRRDAASGLLDPEHLSILVSLVDEQVGTALAGNRFPLVIGGDCPIVLGALRAVARSAPGAGLLHVDAHEDHYLPAASPTGAWSDCEIAFAIGSARFGWDPGLAREQPFVDPSRLALVGVRDADELARNGVKSLGDRVFLRRPDAVRRDPAGIADEAVASVGTHGYWVHLDWDVLDTAVMPAVICPLPGGLDWASLDRLVGAAVADPRCLGLSAGTYNPDRDPDGAIGARIVDHLASWLSGRATRVGFGRSAGRRRRT